MNIRVSEGGRGGPFERMDHTQLIQGFSDQIKVTDAHFLDSFGCWGNTSLKHFCLLVLVSVVAN